MSFWRSNLRLVAILLSIWFAVSYGCGILFVEPLNAFHIGGFPLGFWFAQQGSIYAFIVLVLVYAICLDRLDARYRAFRKATEMAKNENADKNNNQGHDQESDA